MIQPVQRVLPVRFTKKDKEVYRKKDEPQSEQRPPKKEHKRRNGSVPPLSVNPMVELENEVEEVADYDQALHQYLHTRDKRPSFDVKA